MSVRKSDDFVADVERQYRWYLENTNEDVAERYPAVEATCGLLGQHPRFGRMADSITRAFATGVSLSCFAPSRSTFSSTK
jgi:plasmid stabilization system protein ParE